MRNICFYVAVTAFLCSFSFLHGKEIHEGMKITPEMSEKILEKITAKYSKMYEKYAGVKSVRHVTVEWRHPRTDKLLEKEEVVYTRYDYFYDNLVYEVHKYTVDGEERNPKSYDPRESKPGIPHFDKNGHKEYEREVVAIEKVDGRLCYKIKATPRRPKDEHFAGYIWVTVDGLELIQNEGSSGRMRFGVSDLYVKYKAKDFGDYFFFTSGYVKVTLNVLGLYRRTLIFNFVNKNIEPIPKK